MFPTKKSPTVYRPISGFTLRRLIRSQGYTQKRIAEIVGVVPSAVCYWCGGAKRLELDHAEMLAALLGYNLSDLFTPEPRFPHLTIGAKQNV